MQRGSHERATRALWWPVLVGSAGSLKEGMREQESSGTVGGGRHGGVDAGLGGSQPTDSVVLAYCALKCRSAMNQGRWGHVHLPKPKSVAVPAGIGI